MSVQSPDRSLRSSDEIKSVWSRTSILYIPYCLLLKQIETSVNERRFTVTRKWCLAITVCLLVSSVAGLPILNIV